MSDPESLITACKKNNRTAQAQLYNWLAPKLTGLCLRYMQNRDEAEDVMQDAFVKIFMNLNSYKGSGSFEGWAKRIAVNTALSALKQRNRIRFERNLTIVEQIEEVELQEQPITEKDIVECMLLLPDGYRTIMNLCLVEEFSHREVAEKLGISESTSRSQYSRAKQSLLKLIAERAGEKDTHKSSV